jgi:hypothetical protein
MFFSYRLRFQQGECRSTIGPEVACEEKSVYSGIFCCMDHISSTLNLHFTYICLSTSTLNTSQVVNCIHSNHGCPKSPFVIQPGNRNFDWDTRR